MLGSLILFRGPPERVVDLRLAGRLESDLTGLFAGAGVDCDILEVTSGNWATAALYALQISVEKRANSWTRFV